MNNLFESLSLASTDEIVDVLAEGRSVRIERIVSTGHASPADFWYDQDEHEWIAVLRGEAMLELPGEPAVTMRPGDTRLVRAHQKHRVAWTSPNEPTVWLAVFFRD
ncbi:MAG: cupin domain-containing protein [Planctomycetaceae bacterium]|nr:MAG: cupin domain-containing protein [Planctomycetaceae bacterium]